MGQWHFCGQKHVLPEASRVGWSAVHPRIAGAIWVRGCHDGFMIPQEQHQPTGPLEELILNVIVSHYESLWVIMSHYESLWVIFPYFSSSPMIVQELEHISGEISSRPHCSPSLESMALRNRWVKYDGLYPDICNIYQNLISFISGSYVTYIIPYKLPRYM